MSKLNIDRWFENEENPDCKFEDAPDEPIKCQYCNNIATKEIECQETGEAAEVELVCDKCEEQLKEQGFDVTIREEL